MAPEPTSLDRVPLDRLVAGEKRAWDAFVAAAAPVVRGVVRRVLLPAGAERDAADVVQDVFARLCRDRFRLLREFDPARARLSTWLGVIASSAAIDHLRRAGPPARSLDDVPEADLPASEALEPSPPLSLPDGLVTPRQLLILKLLYEDDCTVEEAARALGLDAQTVRSQRHKAFERLRAWLAAKTGGD